MYAWVLPLCLRITKREKERTREREKDRTRQREREKERERELNVMCEQTESLLAGPFEHAAGRQAALSVCLSVCLSICLSVCLSVCTEPVCLSAGQLKRDHRRGQ